VPGGLQFERISELDVFEAAKEAVAVPSDAHVPRIAGAGGFFNPSNASVENPFACPSENRDFKTNPRDPQDAKYWGTPVTERVLVGANSLFGPLALVHRSKCRRQEFHLLSAGRSDSDVGFPLLALKALKVSSFESAADCAEPRPKRDQEAADDEGGALGAPHPSLPSLDAQGFHRQLTPGVVRAVAAAIALRLGSMNIRSASLARERLNGGKLDPRSPSFKRRKHAISESSPPKRTLYFSMLSSHPERKLAKCLSVAWPCPTHRDIRAKEFVVGRARIASKKQPSRTLEARSGESRSPASRVAPLVLTRTRSSRSSGEARRSSRNVSVTDDVPAPGVGGS
jgi:hypothetical protein